jgi:uncharacterized protein
MPYRQQKIFNDPVYGFVSVPKGLLLDIIDHPYFQRLRRIRQTGLAHYVYPGALHTRFHHALGALHLMQQAIECLRSKQVDITDEEAEAVCAAILLHDIGHGPYSHALEHSIVDLHHEDLSLRFMSVLNDHFGGQLSLAIAIFSNQYHKQFLYQLVSGQLDMDRMDYLNRDSFFTGVSEGVIGYDRIIKMLAVHDGALVVEEKGIYSVEKFLMARRLMYWQVYLHKTSVVAEQMLTHTLMRARELADEGSPQEAPPALSWFLNHSSEVAQAAPAQILERFARLDDNDVSIALKYWQDSPDPTLRYLSTGLVNRKLFRLEWHQQPIPGEYQYEIEEQVRQRFSSGVPLKYLIFNGMISNQAYSEAKEPILIVFKNGQVRTISECSDVPLYTQLIQKYYLIYPKADQPLFA